MGRERPVRPVRGAFAARAAPVAVAAPEWDRDRSRGALRRRETRAIRRRATTRARRAPRAERADTDDARSPPPPPRRFWTTDFLALRACVLFPSPRVPPPGETFANEYREYGGGSTKRVEEIFEYNGRLYTRMIETTVLPDGRSTSQARRTGLARPWKYLPITSIMFRSNGCMQLFV